LHSACACRMSQGGCLECCGLDIPEYVAYATKNRGKVQGKQVPSLEEHYKKIIYDEMASDCIAIEWRKFSSASDQSRGVGD
jgi:hypothetical protein